MPMYTGFLAKNTPLFFANLLIFGRSFGNRGKMKNLTIKIC